MSYFDIEKIFRTKENKVLRPTSFWPSNYYRDWIIILAIFATCLLVLSFFAWRIYLSDQLGGGYIKSTGDNKPITERKIDKKRLTDNLSALEVRDSRYISIKINRPKTIDPSY